MNKEQELRLHGPFKTDDFASYIYGSNDKIGGDNPVLEIRGWGYLTGNGHGALGLSHAEAVAEQKRFASFVVDALNAAAPPAVAAGGVTDQMVDRAWRRLNGAKYITPDDVRAALSAALAVGDEGIREGWRDIETAPKDGSLMLLSDVNWPHADRRGGAPVGRYP